MTNILCFSVILFNMAFVENYKPVKVSLNECIKGALEKNLDLKVELYNPRIQRKNIVVEESKFDPVFSFNFSYNNFEKEKFFKTTSGDAIDVDATATLYKKYFSGTSVRLQYETGYDRLNDADDIVGFDGSDSFWAKDLSIKVTQPLLRNLGVGVNTAGLRIAERNTQIREYEMQQKILEVITEIRFLYLDLCVARDSVKFQQQSLRFATNFFQMTRENIKEGMMAPASEIEARRVVADRKQQLIMAQKKLILIGNKIKKMTTPLDRGFYGETMLVPSDNLSFTEIGVDYNKRMSNAMKHRRDLYSGKLSLQNAETLVGFYQNQLLPQLDVTAGIGLQGLNGELSGAYDSVSQSDFVTWKVGLAFEIPLGNRLAKSKYDQSRLKREQTEEKLNKIKNQILFDVQQSIVNLQAETVRVKVTKQNKRFVERQLGNQRIKYQEGMIPLFQLQDTEEKLTKARIGEVKAIADHERAIAALDFAEGNFSEVMSQFFIRINTNGVQ